MPVSMTPYRVFPDYRHIDPAFFTRHGIRLLLCDLDYTLAPKSQPEPDDALRRWLSEVQAAGVTVMILSNNRSPARVERFCRDLGITYDTDLIRLVDVFRSFGLYVGSIALNQYSGQPSAALFETRMKALGLKVFRHIAILVPYLER